MSPASNTNDSTSSQKKVVPLDPFWLNRWQALDQSIRFTMKKIPKEKEFFHFKCTLKALRDFGRSHFFYFFLGFGGKIEEGENPLSRVNRECCLTQQKWFNELNSNMVESHLEINTKHPPSYVLRRIIDQISLDFEAIQRAYYQRVYGPDTQKSTLMLADKWGTEILSEFKMKNGRGLEDEALVITYFDHATKINICPYTNVALIGIPFTATAKDDYRDLLLLPHELGHYVYHKAKIEEQPLKQYIDDALKLAYIPSSNDKTENVEDLKNDVEQVLNWSEELFCDVFGLFTSREPAVVATTLSMVADNHPHHAFWDNGTYPIDALRLWISLIAIKDIEDKLNNASIAYTLSHGYLKLISNSAKSYIEELKEGLGRQQGIENHEKTAIEQANQTLDNSSGKKPPQLTPLETVLLGFIKKIVTELLEFTTIHSWHSIGAKEFKVELDAVMIEINSLNSTGSIQDFAGEDDSSNSDPKPEVTLVNIGTLYKAISLRLKDRETQAISLAEVKNYTELYKLQKEELRNFPIEKEELRNYSIETEKWRPIFEANGWGVRGPEGRPTGDSVNE